MNYARIVDDVAVDVCENPELSFVPVIAKEFIQVPDHVKVGFKLIDQEWVVAEPSYIEKIVPTKEELLKIASEKIKTLHENTILALVDRPTTTETSTWHLKLSTAKCIKNKEPLSGEQESFLEKAKLLDEEKIQAWANSTIENADIYAKVTGAVEYARNTIKGKLKSTENVYELQEIIDTMEKEFEDIKIEFLKQMK